MSHPGTKFQIFTIVVTWTAAFVVTGVFAEPIRLGLLDYPEYFWECSILWFYFIFAMTNWAEYEAARTKNTAVTIYIGFTGGKCEKCGITRPGRAHHCSACGECILRMDHHCVWINNCVGHNNYKSFYLFVFYLTIGMCIYGYFAVIYYFYTPNEVRLPRFLGAAVLLETAIVALTFVMANALLLGHFVLMLHNTTTLESLQGKSVSCAFWKKDIENYHNQGLVANLLQVFGTNPVLWWLPLPVSDGLRGQFFPVVPTYSSS